MKRLIIKTIRRLGYEIVKRDKVRSLPSDFESLHKEIVRKVQNNTMTSPERIYSLIEAVLYVEKYNIPGAIVECGVWKGGSMMAVAHTLAHLGRMERDLFLYDTYEGMSEPDDRDKTFDGASAKDLLAAGGNKEKNMIWAYSTLETVQEGMQTTRYPGSKIHYIKGKVEDTIPGALPEEIAILRLDTDWYESTRHELEHLYPRLKKGGVLILDDYGHWVGARKAVEEYFGGHRQPILLDRIDETGRTAIKQL